jgi:hypothetical protein
MERDCEKCMAFQERAAIIEFDGALNRVTAEQIARFDVCYGCDGAYGRGLLLSTEYSIPKLQVIDLDA